MRRRRIKLGSHRTLDLHRSSGGDDGRGHHCRGMGGSCSQDGGSRAGRPAGSDNAASGSAGGRSAPGAASGADQPDQHAQRPEHGSEGRKLTADAAQLVAILPASGAVVEVAPGQAARTDASVVCLCQLAPDLLAGGIARFDSGRQSDPGPHQQRLDGRDGEGQGIRDVRVRHSAHFTHQQRRSLLIRQPADVGD
jgi:hypothetical protein